MAVYFRIQSTMNRGGAPVDLSTIFSDFERAKQYKQSLIDAGKYRESDIRISTVDKDGKAIQA